MLELVAIGLVVAASGQARSEDIAAFRAFVDRAVPASGVIEAQFDLDHGESISRSLVGYDLGVRAYYRASSGHLIVGWDGRRYGGGEGDVAPPAESAGVVRPLSVGRFLTPAYAHETRRLPDSTFTRLERRDDGSWRVEWTLPDGDVARALYGPPYPGAPEPGPDVVVISEFDRRARLLRIEHRALEGRMLDPLLAMPVTFEYDDASGMAGLVPISRTMYGKVTRRTKMEVSDQTDPARFEPGRVQAHARAVRTTADVIFKERALAGGRPIAPLEPSQVRGGEIVRHSGGFAAYRWPMVGLGVVLVGIGALAWWKRR